MTLKHISVALFACLLLLSGPALIAGRGTAGTGTNSPASPGPAKSGSIRAGFARQSITPELPMWMTGYAARQKPADGTIHELWAKALALQDSSGSRVVIVTVDLLGLSHEIVEQVAARVNTLYGIKRSQLFLNSSHTHSGPLIWPCLDVIYELAPEDQQRVSQYGHTLTDELVKVVGAALAGLHPAILSSGHGQGDFAINRRNAIHPNGPTDQDLPVLKIAAPDGRLEVVLFGYACHNTTIQDDVLQFNGDYAGFAQLEVEKNNPGAMAMFMLGCAGDQNPAPRGTVELARIHGKSLADSVQQVLGRTMKPVSAPIRTDAVTIDLAFRSFDLENYRKDITGPNKFLQRRAKLMLEAYNKGWVVKNLPYPVQVVRFNKDLAILGLSDEVVVDYSLRAKKEFAGENLFVAGYSSEVQCYIPSKRILSEGGYEPEESMIYYAFPGPFADDVEERVDGAIRKLMKNVGAKLTAPAAPSAAAPAPPAASPAASPVSAADLRRDKIRGALGTYAFPPRFKDGRVNARLLISQLKELHANTYHWLAWGRANDLAALTAFLPLAREAGIKVWVTLVPQSESPPYQKDFSEPYRLDFKKWAVGLATLSLKETNLVAWSIDDFVHNLNFLTPEYVKDFLDAARAVNPGLAFVPCSYFEQITPTFVAAYGPLLDGILFPYRNESVSANLQDASHVSSEIATLRSMFAPGFPIFLDIYATAHSSLGDSTPEYVRTALAAGRQSADGVLIYCHQDPVRYPEKYKTIQEGFSTQPKSAF